MILAVVFLFCGIVWIIIAGFYLRFGRGWLWRLIVGILLFGLGVLGLVVEAAKAGLST